MLTAENGIILYKSMLIPTDHHEKFFILKSPKNYLYIIILKIKLTQIKSIITSFLSDSYFVLQAQADKLACLFEPSIKV